MDKNKQDEVCSLCSAPWVFARRREVNFCPMCWRVYCS